MQTTIGAPAMPVDNSFASMSETLKQILVTLRGSSIAEEYGETSESKFWATYKKVSIEYDNGFLERANDDMAIILTFAGLFSAVNSTFIIGMQPNPADTTNALMLQMISIMANGPDTVDTSTLSSITTYPSSKVWVQTLSYASLAFSLLAAFGAVLGKQWLHSYKAAHGQGSLKERGEQRQKKFDGLKLWQLQTVLKSFLVLLEISLLLFALSLVANMWTQHRAIATVIICITAFGTLFYVVTIIVSVLFPYSPFHTAESTLMVLNWKKLRKVIRTVLPLIVAIPKSPIWETFGPERAVLPRIRYRVACAYMQRFFGWIRRIPFVLRGCRICGAMYHFVGYPQFLARFYKSYKRLSGDSCAQTSSIYWLLETSTDPVIIDVAVEMIPLVQWTGDRDVSEIHARLRDTLRTSHGGQELFLKCRKVMAHLCVQPVKINKNVISEEHDEAWKNKGLLIRDAFMQGYDAWEKLKVLEKDDAARRKLEAGIRTALRTMVTHGVQGTVSLPDDDKVIWDGDLRWDESDERPSSCKFDWLIDYLMDKINKQNDDETQGDALLALSAMHGLGSDAKRADYVRALIHCMDPNRPSRVRSAALRAVFDARKELSSIGKHWMPSNIDDDLLDKLLSAALLTAVGDHAKIAKYPARERCYLRLILALTKEEGWRQRLTRLGHVDQWTSLISDPDPRFMSAFSPYIAGICSQFNPAGDDALQGTWGRVMRHAWCGLDHMEVADEGFGDCIEILPALVAATKQNLPLLVDTPDLPQHVLRLLQTLQKLQKHGSLRGDVPSVVQLVQDFSDYLQKHRMKELLSTTAVLQPRLRPTPHSATNRGYLVWRSHWV